MILAIWALFRFGARRLAAIIDRRYGRIAQLVEQLTLNQRVLGSNPSASTITSSTSHFF